MAILSRPAIRELGYEDHFFSENPQSQKILDDAVGITAEGTVMITQFEIRPPSGVAESKSVSGLALQLNFSAYAIKAKAEDSPPDGHIKIEVLFDGPMKPFEAYSEAAGLEEGVLIVELAKEPKQGTLSTTAEEEPKGRRKKQGELDAKADDRELAGVV